MSAALQLIIKHFRQDTWNAFFRFSLPLALCQLPAIRELDGVRTEGPNFADMEGLAASERVAAELRAQHTA